MVAVVEAVFVAPAVSVTVSETENAPAFEYACVGVAPVLVAPSPKFHAYRVIDCPVGAVDFVPSKVVDCPTMPV
jgi:hypothetical protein